MIDRLCFLTSLSILGSLDDEDIFVLFFFCEMMSLLVQLFVHYFWVYFCWWFLEELYGFDWSCVVKLAFLLKVCTSKCTCIHTWLIGLSSSISYPFSYNINSFKQFSLAWVRSLSKTFLFQATPFYQTVLSQSIQFTISIDFVYT